MSHRSHLPAGQRAVRSRLAQLIHSKRLLRGTVVTMSRTCGKQGCKCTRGNKHLSLYLSIRVGKRRRMIYVPADHENAVRSWVGNYREAEGLIEQLSQACLDGFLKEKQRARASTGEKGR